ncbi:MAG: DNA cytosine methyltransferase [Bacteroidales bacterium]|jgi:DNA (cytosine-5)-methyltransferase 1
MGIPVIDLFAGPGGLAEGFSSVFDANGERAFDIRLSIEMDEFAHKTLLFRSFYRQFDRDKLPEEYYNVLMENNSHKREDKLRDLYSLYKNEYEKACEEAWQCELGSEPEQIVDLKISKALDLSKNWVLIGGPPCQAYSLVGRSRVGGIRKKDHRVYLYKEYLRIISKHQPSVFVMENVQGLLSAKLGEDSIFKMMLKDLRCPSKVFTDTKSNKYKIYSFIAPPNSHIDNEPMYLNDEDFLIKMEDYGIPQARHRVILLGIREDIKIKHIRVLNKNNDYIKLHDIIGNMPKLRSGISKRIVSSYILKERVRHRYERIIDSNTTWSNTIKRFIKELGISGVDIPDGLNKGNSYVECITHFSKTELQKWFVDKKLKGVTCHETRCHLESDLKRYLFAAHFLKENKRSPKLKDYPISLLPSHKNATSGKFEDRFRVQDPEKPATTITSHISKDGHYFIHYDPSQCRSLTVREAARIQTFPDNYYFWGNRTQQYHQVGNAVPPLLAKKLSEIVKSILINE